MREKGFAEAIFDQLHKVLQGQGFVARVKVLDEGADSLAPVATLEKAVRVNQVVSAS